MKKRLILLILIFLILNISCTSRKNVIDFSGYNPGTDWQYFQTTAFDPAPKIQEYDGGCYLYHDHFVYVYEHKSGRILPLCSKPNCLHDKETEPGKISDCNAFLEGINETAEVSVRIFLYKNDLYCIFPDAVHPSNADFADIHSIYRIASDGSSQELVAQTDSMEIPLVHRGYLYYYGETYHIDEKTEDIIWSWSLFRMDLVNSAHKVEELLNAADLGKDHTIMVNLKAYGNYVIYTAAVVAQDSDDSEQQNAKTMRFVYDTRSGKSEIYNADMNYTFFNGKEICNPSAVVDNDHLKLVPVYAKNGREEPGEMVINECASSSYLVTDNKYLYINNCFLNLIDSNIEKRFWVYDQDFELIDEFTLPDTDTHLTDPPIGGQYYQYQLYEDETAEEWGLYIWDKSSIGTLHGKPYSQEKVVGGLLSSAEPPVRTVSEPVITYIGKLSDWTESVSERFEDSWTPDFADLTVYAKTTMTNDLITAVSGCTVSTKDREERMVVIAYYASGDDVYEIRQRGQQTGGGREMVMEITLPENGDYFLGTEVTHDVIFSFDEDAQKSGWYNNGRQGYTEVGRVQ